MCLLRYILPFALLFTTGCANLSWEIWGSVPEEPKISYFDHTVSHSGETVAAIAGWYTGDSANWKEILTHNPDLNIRNIQIGQTIRIPKALMQRTKPLPLKFVKMWNQQVKTASIQKPSVYNVQSISGCNHLPNNPKGLYACAQLISHDLMRML